jgi:hypothetical protein
MHGFGLVSVWLVLISYACRLDSHILNPYPTKEELLRLVHETGLTEVQGKLSPYLHPRPDLN